MSEASGRNVVDSSGWLEYFADGPNADFFEAAVEDASSLVVPTISIYEVFKRLLRESGGEDDALRVVAAMQRGELVDLGAELALDAARTAHELKLPMADAVILTTARAWGATLWTQDADFEGLPGVRFVRKEG
ncbi:PIN domain-containing protein [Rubrobacter marinus]|uniref:Ribonuclease VapC n=1 Tax=Rubrobacter marinus TaxID=2653852 RepID=A0A6G8PSU0_9ACTN|nr:type II toxin-antitoxin system VapC family toxin [Rubrobacter marinus]QIN77393.1 PIN domain-containing protein [Rubrobacter marinus]